MGPTFVLQPTLTGPRLELRPLRPDDFDALYSAASDPLIWETHHRLYLIGDANIRSRKAMEKIGGVLSGSLEKTGSDGRPRRNVVYRIEKKNP